MSNFVHLRIAYYKPGSERKSHLPHKTDAKRWDQRSKDKRGSYLNGVIMRAGGMGSRLYSVKETKRTKT